MPAQSQGSDASPDMEIPDQIEIKQSSVDSEAMGLWCSKLIPLGTKFGPFMGNKVQEATDDMDPSYVWEIVDLETKEFLFYIDATDPGMGNWMRYINCARYFEEQNIVSEQEGIDIVYRAIKDINPGEELLTWYEKAPLRKRRGKKARKTFRSSVSSRRRALSRNSSTESQQQQQQQQQQQSLEKPEQEQQEQPQEPISDQLLPTPSSSSASLTLLDPQQRETEDLAAVAAAAGTVMETTIGEDGQPLRRSKRKCPKKSSVQDDDFIYGSDNDQDDEEDDEDDVDDEEDDINEDDAESFNGSIPDVFHSDNIEIDTSFPAPDTGGFYQFEVKPYHNVKSRLGRKVFQCDICSGVYRHTFSLKRHYIRNHINYKYVSKTDRLNCNVNYNEVDNVSNASSLMQEKEEVPSRGSLSDREETGSDKTPSSSSSSLGDASESQLLNVSENGKVDEAEKEVEKEDLKSGCKTEDKIVNGDSLPEDVPMDSEKTEKCSSQETEKAKGISAETLKENIETEKAKVEGTQGGKTDAKSMEKSTSESGFEINRDAEPSTKSIETKNTNQTAQDSEASANNQNANNGGRDCENQSQSDADSDDCKHGSCAEIVPCSDCKMQPSASQAPSSECKALSVNCKEASCAETAKITVPCSDSKEGETQSKVPFSDFKEDSSSEVPSGDHEEENPESPPGDYKDGSKTPSSDHTECEEPSVKCKPNNCKESSNVPSSLGEKNNGCEMPSTNCKGECNHSHCKLPSETCKEQLTENKTDPKLNEQTEVCTGRDTTKEAVEQDSEKDSDVKAGNRKSDPGDVKANCSKPDPGGVKSDNSKPDVGDLKEDVEKKTDGKAEKETLQNKVTDTDSLPDCPQQQCIPSQDKVVPSEFTKDNIHEPETGSPLGPSKVGILMPGVFRCNICEALFDTIPELKVHLQHHPDVPSSKKFACNQCDMKFSHKQNLMRHQAVHSGTKPYVCKYCGKKFPTVTNLKRHERLHQGRRYSCECCGATFTQTGDLKKHFRKVHPESFHECGFCCKYYTGREQLVEHLELIHPGEDLGTNKKELSMRIQVFKVDSKKDRAESMRMALAKPGHRFACTVCKKRFHDYANMCRHRRLAHQKQVLLSRRLTQSPQITMEALYGSFTDGDCVRPGGEFDFPSQYYANVARNIADNLSTYLEGKQEELERPDNYIKWKEPEPEKEVAVVKSAEKKTKNTGTAETTSMMKYNFPRGFQIKSTTELWKRKVNYFLKSPEKLLEEWMDSDVRSEADTEGSSGTVEIMNPDIKTEMPNEEPTPSPAHSQDSGKTGMKSPPPLQRKPNVAASGPASGPTSASAQPPKPPQPIRVPILHTCNICRCVLHNYGLYRQHMLYKHKIQIAAQTPDLLDRIPGLQPVAVSVASAVDSEHEGSATRTVVTTATAAVAAPSATSNSAITQAPSLRITANLQSVQLSSNANAACPMSPPAHSSCARSPPAHSSSSPLNHIHYPLAKTPPAHLSSAVSPRAHSSMITIPSNHSEQPLDLSSPKSRYPPVNPFDPVPTGAINLTLAKLDTPVSEEASKMAQKNNDEPVDLTGGNSQSGEPQTHTDKSKDGKIPDSASEVDKKPNSVNPTADEPSTDRDQNSENKKKKKVKNTKQLCLACYEEFEDLPALYGHQESEHAALDCRHGSRLETRPGMKALCCYVPNAVGLLNVCASQLPEQKENVASKAVSCTKCNTTYPAIGDLHKHIIDFCANDGKPQEIHYGYIWIYRGKIRAKKRRKYRRPQNTPRKQSSVFDGVSHRRRGLFDSVEDEEGGRKRRRGMYELMYNPLNHIRRREMAEIVDTQSCRGCGEQFKTISMLERHIPVCSHKDRLREIHIGKSQQEEDEDSDAYDPTKHMCIYCERLFTYLGMLRNHILDICPVRKDFVEQGEPLDDEWEQDIISRAGPRETATLSRQSSMSSLVGIAGEDGEEEETSRSKRGKKRKKRRHNWGYRVKNGERRQSKNSEEGDSSMSPGGGFALHDESSNSMPGKDDSLASNSAEGNQDEAGKTTVLEEKAHFSSVRTKSEGIDTSQTREFENSTTRREETSNDLYDEDTENTDNEEKTPNVKAEPEVAEKPAAKGNKRKVSTESKKSPTKKIKLEEKSAVKQPVKTPKKTPSKAPKVTPQPKAKSPVKKTKPSKSVKSALEDSGVGDEDVDSDDDDVALSMLVASPKSDPGSLPSPKSVSKKTPAKSKTTNKKATVSSAKKTPQNSATKTTKNSKSGNPVKSPTKAKSPVKKSPAKSVKKTTKKTEVVKKFITRRQSWAASVETATQLAKSKSVSPTKGKGPVTKTKNRSASETKSGGKAQSKSGKEKPPSLSSVKKKLKL